MSRTLNSIFKIKPWFRNNIIKRPEYFVYCAVPTEIAGNQTNSSSISLFDNFDMSSTAIDTVGLGTFVIGSIVFAWCKVQEMSSRNHLITRGFYRYSRNPMAMACMLSLVGGCMLTHNPWFAAAIPSIGYIALNFYVIPFEEKQLLQKFGKEYEEYKKQTNRWITFDTSKKSENS